MKEKEYFIDKVDEASEINLEISDVHKDRMKGLNKLFKLYYGRKPFEFAFIKDLLFYRIGIPNEDSASKVSKIMEKFILMVQYYQFLGKMNTIDNMLEGYGIEIIVKDFNPKLDNRQSTLQKFDRLWEQMYPGQDPDFADEKSFFNFLLDEAMEIEGTVVALKREVKEVHTEDVKIKCEVEPKNFTQAINLKTKSMKGKDNTERIQKIEKDIEDLSEVIDIIK